MDEIWKDVPGLEGLYEVSNLGRVRSRNGRSGGVHLLTPTFNRKRNYYYVSVQTPRIRRNWILHRLVATVFCDNPFNLPCVDHVDGDKTNNIASNLEWVTYKENSQRALKLGLIKPYNHAKAKKVTPEMAISIFNDKRKNKVIASEYGLGESTVTHIKLGSRWGKITNPLQAL